MLLIGLSMSFTLTPSCVVYRLALPLSCAVTVRISSLPRLNLFLLSWSADLVNDTYACENDKTLNDILKREYAFQGFVMSDWGAHHATLDAVQGLDVSYWPTTAEVCSKPLYQDVDAG